MLNVIGKQILCKLKSKSNRDYRRNPPFYVGDYCTGIKTTFTRLWINIVSSSLQLSARLKEGGVRCPVTVHTLVRLRFN